MKKLTASAHIYQDKIQSGAFFSQTPNTVYFNGSNVYSCWVQVCYIKSWVNTCVLSVLKWGCLTWQSRLRSNSCQTTEQSVLSAPRPRYSGMWRDQNSLVHLWPSYVSVTPSHKLFGFPWGGEKILPLTPRTLSPWKRPNIHITEKLTLTTQNTGHIMFDHRSFIVKHEHNESVCTKQLLQITRLPSRDQASSWRSRQMLKTREAGLWWPSCLQAELCPPPVSPLGIVPENMLWNLTQRIEGHRFQF